MVGTIQSAHPIRMIHPSGVPKSRQLIFDLLTQLLVLGFEVAFGLCAIEPVGRQGEQGGSPFDVFGCGGVEQLCQTPGTFSRPDPIVLILDFQHRRYQYGLIGEDRVEAFATKLEDFGPAGGLIRIGGIQHLCQLRSNVGAPKVW